MSVRKRKFLKLAPAVGFGGSFPVFAEIETQFTQLIKQTLALLKRAFSVLFAGNFADTYLNRYLRLSQYWNRQRRRFESDTIVMEESEKGHSCGLYRFLADWFALDRRQWR
jgi:hypothetical protein